MWKYSDWDSTEARNFAAHFSAVSLVRDLWKTSKKLKPWFSSLTISCMDICASLEHAYMSQMQTERLLNIISFIYFPYPCCIYIFKGWVSYFSKESTRCKILSDKFSWFLTKILKVKAQVLLWTLFGRQLTNQLVPQSSLLPNFFPGVLLRRTELSICWKTEFVSQPVLNLPRLFHVSWLAWCSQLYVLELVFRWILLGDLVVYVDGWPVCFWDWPLTSPVLTM